MSHGLIARSTYVSPSLCQSGPPRLDHHARSPGLWWRLDLVRRLRGGHQHRPVELPVEPDLHTGLTHHREPPEPHGRNAEQLHRDLGQPAPGPDPGSHQRPDYGHPHRPRGLHPDATGVQQIQRRHPDHCVDRAALRLPKPGLCQPPGLPGQCGHPQPGSDPQPGHARPVDHLCHHHGQPPPGPDPQPRWSHLRHPHRRWRLLLHGDRHQ